MGRISAVRGQAGDLLNRADRISDDQGKRSIQLESDRSTAVDLDMVSNLRLPESTKPATRQRCSPTLRVQKLSLFNYIS